MRIQTILNRVEKFKSFVYGRVELGGGQREPSRGGGPSTSEKQPPVVFRMWPARSCLRPPGGTEI